MSTLLTLNNGVRMPALGLGVYQSAPEETVGAVESALRTGYRLIDTAAAYGNEREVGEGLRRSGVPRSDVFLETKVWISQYGYDRTLRAFDLSTRKLGVDRLDLLLLHQPMPDRFDATLEAYRALETLLSDGRVRAIGVSNFAPEHLDRLLERSEVVPAVNQIEVHPYFTQTGSRAAHDAHGVLTQAWSPIGGVNVYWPQDGEPVGNPLEDPVIGEIARRYDKTPAQVVLRWHLQQGRAAIPKSVRAARIEENFAVFDFALTAEELSAVDALDTGVRGGPEPGSISAEPDDSTIAQA